MRFSRQFAMPNHETFSLSPVSALLDRYINGGVIIDPFARNSTRGTVTNDLNPTTSAQFHLRAEEFVLQLDEGSADAVLFDPPYSPAQMKVCYQSIGLKTQRLDGSNAYLYRVVKDGLDKALKSGGVAICCGWNSMGFGLTRGYEMLELLLVTHGAAHNDTIVTVERKR